MERNLLSPHSAKGTMISDQEMRREKIEDRRREEEGSEERR
jgi:hypothetical protein